MNKTELKKAIAKAIDAEAKSPEKEAKPDLAKAALEAMLEAIKNTLKKGDKVALIGFGTWSVTNRPARKGRNPQTGKEIQIAAKKVIKFKAGSELSDSVK